MPETPKIEFYELKITDLSALLLKEIKSAGGYRTELGSKFSFILHEMNSAFGSIHSLISVLKARAERLQAEAQDEATDIDRYQALNMIEDVLNPDRKGWREPTPEMEQIVSGFLAMGWKPPKRTK